MIAPTFFLMSFMTLLPCIGITAPSSHSGSIPCFVSLTVRYLKNFFSALLISSCFFDEIFRAFSTFSSWFLIQWIFLPW